MNWKSVAALSALSCMLATTPAHAAYVVNATEVGSDVVFTGSGSVDLTALTVSGAPMTPGFFFGGGAYLLFGDLASSTKTAVGISGPVFLAGSAFVTAPTRSGEFIGVAGDQNLLQMLNTYTSGTVLSAATLTFKNMTFANLGEAAGNTYTWTWGSGGTADSYTLNFVAAPPPPAVPEPGTWAMMLLGMGTIGAAMRRGRKAVRMALA